MTIDFTVVTDTSLNITSASVNDPSFTAPSSGAQAPPRALQAGVARSQSQVVSTNIGTRISSIGGGPSGGGASAGPGTPAGTGGNTGGQSVPGTGTGSDSGDDDGQSNFAGFQRTVGGSTWRDFAMLASFDTSALFGVTATDGASSPTTPVDRAAFAPSRNLTFWGHGSFTNVENSRNDGDTDSRYTGDVWGYNLGLDYRFASGFVAGLSVGYSETALDTTFNTGDYTEENITLTPYAVYPLNDNLSLSFFGGASVGDVEQTRDSGTVRGTTDSLMLMAAFGASYSLTPDDNIPLDLTAKFDLNVSHKTIDAYTESDGSVVEEQTSNTRQVSPGLEAAYRFDLGDGNTLAPFGSAAMVYDFLDPINGDDVAYELGGGLRVTSDSTGWSGSIEADTQLDRRDYQQYSVKGTIAYGMTVDLFGEAASDETVSFTVAPQFVSETPSLTSSMRYTHAESGLSFDLDVTHVLPQLAGGASNTRGDVKLTLPF